MKLKGNSKTKSALHDSLRTGQTGSHGGVTAIEECHSLEITGAVGLGLNDLIPHYNEHLPRWTARKEGQESVR